MDFIEYKELESRIFGIRIGQVKISKPEDTTRIYGMDSMGYDLVDIRVPYQLTSCIKDVQTLGTESVRYVGSIVTYELDINSSGIMDRNLYVTKNCRLATSEDLKDCINIVKESFVELEDGINRFNLDPNFKKSDIEKYYVQWVENIFNGNSADEVVVYIDDDNTNDNGNGINGFISIKKIEDNIDNICYNIPLNAVKRSERGKGIYKEMVSWVVDKLRDDRVKINIRAYLGNVAIQKTWLDLEAQIKGMEYVFHGGRHER